MENNNILKYCIDYLSKKSVNKSQCVLTSQKLYEMGCEMDEISLLRSNYSEKIDITAIKDNKRGNISTNDLNEESLHKTLDKLIDLTESSKQDEDYDISPYQESKSFSKGDQEPNLDKMFELLTNLIKGIKLDFPKISLRSISLTFNQINKKFLNSNETSFESYKGVYQFSITFMAKDGNKISSFNYTGASFENLPDNILAFGNLKEILDQTSNQLEPSPVDEKFEGDVIITPQCLSSIIGMFTRVGLSDAAVYTKTSKLADKLNEKVASEKLTLHSSPVDKEISNGYFITGDGYSAENSILVKNGVLKSFLLSDYGAKKAKKERSKNTGGCYIVDAGDSSLQDMIKNVKRGLFVARISSGAPAANGDFSGIAKNSFYIENGEIKHAVNETMVFGNIYNMLMNVKEISSKRVNLGYSIYPWISIKGMTISGK